MWNNMLSPIAYGLNVGLSHRKLVAEDSIGRKGHRLKMSLFVKKGSTKKEEARNRREVEL
jgi:hypothetical protein